MGPLPHLMVLAPVKLPQFQEVPQGANEHIHAWHRLGPRAGTSGRPKIRRPSPLTPRSQEKRPCTGRDHRNEEEPSLILCSSLQDELDPTQVLRGLLQTANMTGGIIYLSSCNFQQSGTTELDVSKLLRIAESLNGVLDTTTNARTTLRCIPGSHGHDLLEVFLSCTHMYFLVVPTCIS